MHYANACIAVWNFHQAGLHHASHAALQRLGSDALRAAREVDTALRSAIRRYVTTGHGWGRVNYDCGFAQN